MVKQCAIIFGCLAVGEFLAYILHLPVPGSIIGMLFLTLLLQRRIVSVESIRPICRFLVSNMGFFFVPPGVALMLYFDLIKAELWPIVVATVGSTALVLLFTGWSHNYLRHIITNRRKHGNGISEK